MNWGSGLSLGEVIERLEKEDPDLVLPIGWSDADSYRGYYECLAFEPAENVTVADCLAIARQADGTTYTGYKGGEYDMDWGTECYLAPYGCLGDALTATMLDLDILAGKLRRDDHEIARGGAW